MKEICLHHLSNYLSYFTFFSCSWWILSKYPSHLRKYDRCWEHSNAQGRISLAFMKSKGEKDTLWTIAGCVVPSGKCVGEDLIWPPEDFLKKMNFTNDWEKWSTGVWGERKEQSSILPEIGENFLYSRYIERSTVTA